MNECAQEIIEKIRGKRNAEMKKDFVKQPLAGF